MLALLGMGFAAVLSLGAYVLLVERRARTTEDSQFLHGLVLPYAKRGEPLLRDAATRIEIQRRGVTIVLERAADASWRLRQPVDAPADPAAVQAILGALRNLRFTAAIDPKNGEAEAADPYGLHPPRLIVRLWLGARQHEFVVGRSVKGRSAAEKETYIRRAGERRVLLVNEEHIAPLDVEPDALRARETKPARAAQERSSPP